MTKEEKQEYYKAYREANKDKIKDRIREYYEANKDKRKDKNKEYREANKDKRKEYDKEYREANKDKIQEYKNAYREANKDKIQEYMKGYNEANKDRIRESGKEYYEANKDKRKDKKKEYNEANKDKMKDYQKEYSEANKDKINKRKAYLYNNVPLFNLTRRIRSLIYVSLKIQNYKKTSRTAKILGCSFEEFKVHIEEQFPKDMNWDNSPLWQYDHIKPVSSATSEEELLRLNHYTNFQPLWEEDNREKAARLDWVKCPIKYAK